MKLRKYTEQALKDAISNSLSLRETLKKLGVSDAGGNYEVLKKAISFFNIDSSHFIGKGYLKGKNHANRTRVLKNVLVYGKLENTWRLKNRLIKEGLKQPFCECCKRLKWMEEPIPLELHHVDGDRKNNTIHNLELLCPNCHSLTSTYRGKNKKS